MSDSPATFPVSNIAHCNTETLEWAWGQGYNALTYNYTQLNQGSRMDDIVRSHA